MLDLLWDLHQQRRINDAEDQASDASRRSGDTARELTELRRAAEGLALANQALWELLRDRLKLGEQELLDKMQEIDLRDGRRDGRVTPAGDAVPMCGRCNRRLSPRHERCIYCGQPNALFQPFTVR